jgi:hypothetical protein
MKRLFATTALTAAALLCVVGTTSLSTAANAAVTGSVPLPGGPIIRASDPGQVRTSTPASTGNPTISLNWSGYVATSSKPFTSVHSTFVQPAISCPGVANQWTSNWVGLDGYNDQTVEQDGTDAHCTGTNHTTPSYQAWYEMFPANSVNVFNVNPGDIIDSSVTYASGLFTLTVADLTTGKSATTSAACTTCVRSSAEWIIERPALCNADETKCFITELADYTSANMGGDEASVTGGNVKSVADFNNIPIYMVNPVAGGGFISLDTVNPLSGPTFEANWDRSGTTVPITLGPKQ